MEKLYRGIIVEEALDDNLIINEMSVIKLVITNHKKRKNRWHMYEVDITEDKIMELSKHINKGWYIHFWNEGDIIALFKNEIFRFDYFDKSSWADVIKHGVKIGIPLKQLDFPIESL